MPSPTDKARARLERLREAYLDSLPDKRRALTESLRTVDAEDLSEGALRSLRDVVHELAESGATYGLPELSAAASRLEEAVRSALGGSEGERRAAWPKLHAQGQDLCRHLDGAAYAFGRSPPYPGGALGTAGSAHADGRARSETHRVYLADDDPEQAHQLAHQLHIFGFEVQVFAELMALGPAVAAHPPAVVVMDMPFPEGHRAGVEAVHALRRSAVHVPPVVFISRRGDFDARLEAVHAGAVAYFTKPVNVHGLADVMHELVAAHPRSPFRVLIVEDDAGAGRFYQATLERAGIGTRLVRDPSAIMEPLVDFRPELILMDLYLPECSGLDLAALLRQQEAYFNLPIIFVSPEDDADKRLAAIGSGADDYLIKPVDADYLTRLIGMRVRRYRRLERLIATDSLTGLLNQTAFMERLAREVARAGRRGDPLAVAMLDLDYFKQVNDTYGHLEGNNVLKTLALRLRRRLRAGDVVSRFGGEEFTIALVDTELETARRLLDRVREEFAAATHGTGDRFRVTFSVGIAEYNLKTARSDHRSQALALLEQADKALYVAKRERNRVVVSPA